MRIVLLLEADEDQIRVRDLLTGEEQVCLNWQDETREAVLEMCRGVFESALGEPERVALARIREGQPQ